MTNYMRVTVAVGALAVSGCLLTPAFAQDGPPHGAPPPRGMRGPGGPGGGPMGGLLGELGQAMRRLDLSDAQREQVRGVMQSHAPEFRQIGERMRAARQALDAAIAAETFEEAAIRGRSAEWAAVEADSAVLRGKVRQEVFNLLTPEQQARARALSAERQERMKQRGARGPGMRERRGRPPVQG